MKTILTKSFTFLTLLAGVGIANAQSIKGSISFDGSDRARHYQSLDKIMDVAANCLQADYNHHLAFYKRWGVSAFYGSNSAYSKLNREGRINMLRRLGKPAELVDQLKITSCVGLTTKCLERGFNAAGQGDIWAKVKRFVAANSYDGTVLQHALQQLGWKVLYWNPDVRQNSAWDNAERSQASKGRHSIWYNGVMSRGVYYKTRVDDRESLVNFGTNVPRKFSNVPFFVGTAHAGYHVFPGMNGNVIEGHSMRAITDRNTIESAEFNPIKSGGAPRGSYRSGLIAVPPGYGY